ncbi:hypothetical protein ACQPZG_01205 (plasmid) [Streptomyces sp. CA-294286]|uniref:hypothetical protein n=1 Tax=Streptomyces sp. CA-294286 TaxID=3240070 RepID=UPI003D8FE3ED
MMSESVVPLPDRGSLSELLDAERTRALQRIMPPWVYFLLSVTAAAGVWLPSEPAARTVAVASALIPGAAMLLRTGALTRAVVLYQDEGEDGEDAADTRRMAGRMIAITIAVVSVVLGVVALLIPLTWLRIALPVMCLWFVYDLVRMRRSRAQAQQVIQRAEAQDWYPAYTRLIDERRATLG